MKKLNLGCGRDIRKNWVNLDIANLPGVDIVHDINKLPLPFKKEEFDYILCQSILEHTEYIPILKDLHRILKKGGILEICVPHFTSRNNFFDPTHKKMFSFQLFQFFVDNPKIKTDYYFDFFFSRIVSSRITFEKGFLFYNYLIEPLVNLSERTKIFYEITFLSRLFPSANIIVKIEK
jgi:ubiquinone/menaquinone biosynthesis C-methylase UbiE